MTSRGRVVLAAIAFASTAFAPRHVAAFIDSNLAAASNGGGCHPTGIAPALFDMLTLINPEWAPVVSGPVVDSRPVLVRGVVTSMHGDTSGDFPSTHLRADVNFDLAPDPGFEHFVAEGNDGHQIHVEWEAGAYPAWAWAGKGDRMVAMGRLIFDCGHPGAIAGHCSATLVKACANDSDCKAPSCEGCGAAETCEGVEFEYGSEIHPPRATAAIRQGRGGIVSSEPGAKPVLATRVDVFASANGGAAGDRCIVTHQADDLALLAVDCYPLSQPIADINTRNFRFSVPLPPKPAGAGSTPSWRMTLRPEPGMVQSRYRVDPNLSDPANPSLDVVIQLRRDAEAGGSPTGFAGTLEAGWVEDTTPLTHVRVTVRSLLVRNALHPKTPSVPRTCSVADTPCATAADCPQGQQCLGQGPVKSWQGQVSVNGEFREMTGLADVDDGDVVPQEMVFDQYLRADDSLVVHADARSQECIDTMYGHSLGAGIATLGITKGIACLGTEARNPGAIDVSYPGPDFGAGAGGRAVRRSRSVGGVGGTCASAAGTLCTVDADCGAGDTCTNRGRAMSLRYVIERIEE